MEVTARALVRPRDEDPGRPPIRATLDTAVVRALREGLGDGVEMYVDGNRGWSASESARAMQEMADLGLTFAEELCPADDVLGRRWLVGQSTVPFIADESVVTPADVALADVASSSSPLPQAAKRRARPAVTTAAPRHARCFIKVPFPPTATRSLGTVAVVSEL